MHTGQCSCRTGFDGKLCNKCGNGYNNYPNCEIMQCLTTNDADSPIKNAPCVFPFKYDGKMHTSCTIDDDNKLWCSTKVQENGQYLKNQWGYCGNGCKDHCNCKNGGTCVNSQNGQCTCRAEYDGNSCEYCSYGYFNYPNCKGTQNCQH